MATYRNASQGARAIHLTNGTHVLVEAGATHTVEDGKVLRLAPGLVKAKKGELPDPPAEIVDAVSGSDKPEVSAKLNKAQLIEIARAEGVDFETDDNKADLVRKITAARG